MKQYVAIELKDWPRFAELLKRRHTFYFKIKDIWCPWEPINRWRQHHYKIRYHLSQMITHEFPVWHEYSVMFYAGKHDQYKHGVILITLKL